ncbi:MAG: coproporphyrinogen III oxidase [Alphaproteobacteria bacterium]|jgi:oxygen-independent coproporphyrinogen-3 oxidase|nr:coproporphyrinogen III oxidase [Alphaproteobacteria bacterium]
MSGTESDPFGLYVHWPFCLSKCPYCDFNSHVRDRIDQGRWQRAYLAALDRYAAETEGRTVATVFFGGGTPSLMAPETAAAILDRVAALWPVAPDVEVTLEANPTSVEAGRFAAFREAGVNRVSLGVQTLDDSALQALGRGHDRRQALAALALAARHFDRFSFDLIYARPGQTPAAWQAELETALALAGDHLSVYQLTIEPGTAFATLYARGALTLPDEDAGLALYDMTLERLAAAGLPAYEVSNHARPGGECRHNLIYWRGGDYVGIGPGAHGRLTGPAGRVATRAHRAPEVWLDRVEQGGTGEHPRERLEPRTVGEELLLMGLRLTEGIDRRWFRRCTGLDIPDLVDPAGLDRLTRAGLVVLDAAGLRATADGRTRLDAVLAALLA